MHVNSLYAWRKAPPGYYIIVWLTQRAVVCADLNASTD